MRVELMYPSKYLKEVDLAGKEVPVVIDRVAVEELHVLGTSKTEKRPVLYLRSSKTGQKLDKSLVMNKTNAMAIASLYGMETDAWVGKTIVLRPAQDRFQGKLVPCIRIKTDREPGEDG